MVIIYHCPEPGELHSSSPKFIWYLITTSTLDVKTGNRNQFQFTEDFFYFFYLFNLVYHPSAMMAMLTKTETKTKTK
jgi:hypothetical protein